MRIIQILNSPNWSACPEYCVNVSYELMKLGHDVLLMTEPGKPMARALELGIPCDDKLRLNSDNILEYVRNIKHLKQVFTHFKPDIVSAHINKCSWLPGFVARMCCPKSAVVRVRTDIAAPNKNPFNLLVNHKWTDHIISGSELHKTVCCNNLHLSPEKISVVYGSVDSVKFNPKNANSDFRKEIGVSDDDFLVGILGRLSPVKGHEYALKAISELKELPKTVKLLCIGYECERSFDWLKSEAERLGISDRVISIGRRDDLPDVLASVDIGLVASIGSEANSRATLEFMASGKPVVSSKAGVIPELILDNKTGYLTEIANSKEMAEAIKKLVIDKELCLEMGKAARQRVEDSFTLEQFGKKMEAVYESVLKNL